MIPKIRKILYATDLSMNSTYAFRYTINSAKQHNAEIVILHVVEKLPHSVRSLVSAYLDEAQQKVILEEKINHAKERIKKRLKIFAEKELEDQPELLDLISEIEVVEGFAPDEILRLVDELDCDILVMGTHGKDTQDHTYLGSMARRIISRIRKPVFIIPLPSGETDISVHDI